MIDIFEAKFPPDQYDYAISIVTRGEMYSLAACNNWGSAKVEKLKDILDSYLQIRIDNESIVETYSIIDEFGRKAKNPNVPSSRCMAKNDLWIAATATLYSASLATLYGDFDHLESHFFPLNKLVLS